MFTENLLIVTKIIWYLWSWCFFWRILVCRTFRSAAWFFLTVFRAFPCFKGLFLPCLCFISTMHH